MKRPWVRRSRVAGGLLGVCLIAAWLAGCGGGSSHTRTRATAPAKLTPAEIACTAAARDAMASYLRVATSSVAESASLANNDMPQCAFSVQLGHNRHVMVMLNVDDGPQPYYRLERTLVEDSQGFPTIDHAPPSAEPHLGLEASWFPQYPQMMATDGYRLITAAVTWPHEPRSHDRVLARAMTVPFMHPPHGKRAIAVAEGFPSSG